MNAFHDSEKIGNKDKHTTKACFGRRASAVPRYFFLWHEICTTSQVNVIFVRSAVLC